MSSSFCNTKGRSVYRLYKLTAESVKMHSKKLFISYIVHNIRK